MGPPPFGDGNVPASRYSRRGTLVRPSMGPPPFGDGNRAIKSSLGDPFVYLGPSMGPPPFGDGNLTCSSSAGALRASHPSMGPPPFGDGNAVWLTAMVQILSSPFNGATAFRRWKPCGKRLSRLRLDILDLQWGHRLSAMETARWGLSKADHSMVLPLQWGHRLSAMETRCQAWKR